MRTLQRVGAGLLALTLVSGIAACGDDDDEATDATEADAGDAAGGDLAAFCDTLVEFNAAALETEVDDTSSEEDIKAAGEELAPKMETIADNAPEDLAATADELNGYIQPLLEGDAEQFNDDATFETYMGFVQEAIGACEFDTVEVTAVDYAFEGVPDSLSAGTAAFAFSNESESEEHEMIIVRKADGVDLSFDEILNLSEEESEDKVEFKGAAFAGPGSGGSALVELTAGDYAMVCFIPVGGAEDGPPHFTQGMVKEFSVE